jgi:photosystem II stability/assembly factor-like uncharacterized protein
MRAKSILTAAVFGLYVCLFAEGNGRWEIVQKSIIESHFNAVRAFGAAGDLKLIAAGDDGTVARWNNTGWALTPLINEIPRDVDLNDLHFPDPVHGWTVGSSGTILHSTNSGANWEIQQSGTANNLNGVWAKSDRAAFCVGDRGTAVYTADGGTTWNPMAMGTEQNLKRICFSTESIGWVAGYQIILRTSSGGTSWGKSYEEKYAGFNDVCAVGDKLAWAAGNSGKIVHTRDGGTVWEIQATGTLATLHSIRFVDATHGWACGDFGVFLTTEDGGLHWNLNRIGTANSLKSIWPETGDRAYMAGDFASVYLTENGGDDWTDLSAAFSHLTSVHLYDRDHGAAVGIRGGLFLWEQQRWQSMGSIPEALGMTLTSVRQTAPNTLVACQEYGFLRSDDGGTTWSYQQIDEGLTNVHFLDSQLGWAVSRSGSIYRTENGGVDWIPAATDNTHSLEDVKFIDAKNGLAVGDKGTVLYSIDGGKNWLKAQSGTDERVKSLCYLNVRIEREFKVGKALCLTTDGSLLDVAQKLDSLDSPRIFRLGSKVSFHKNKEAPSRTSFRLKLPAASGGESSTFKEEDNYIRSLTPGQAPGNALAVRFKRFEKDSGTGAWEPPSATIPGDSNRSRPDSRLVGTSIRTYGCGPPRRGTRLRPVFRLNTRRSG